jgi:NitT/TauT family transport system substrate-binding protein
VARSEFTQLRPEAARRLILALQSALSFLRENPEEAAGLTMAAAREDPEQFRRMWRDSDFMLDLNQALLTVLEDEARWALTRRGTASADHPRFLDRIDARPLASASPNAVSILLP